MVMLITMPNYITALHICPSYWWSGDARFYSLTYREEYISVLTQHLSDPKLSPLLDDGREFVGFGDESTQVLYYSYTNKDRGEMIQGLAREGQLHHLLEPLLQFPVQEEGMTASWRDTYQPGTGKIVSIVAESVNKYSDFNRN